MPLKKKKTGAERRAAISATMSRIIPLAQGGAYIHTLDAKSIMVKVGSERFYRLLSEYIGTAAAPSVAAHCIQLAESNPEQAVYWLEASSMLSVDADGNAVLPLEDIIAKRFAAVVENATA